MIWKLLAAVIADATHVPLIVLDEGRVVRLLNPSMEQLLGRRRNELVGAAWPECCAPSERMSEVVRTFSHAVAGPERRCECPVVTADGRLLSLTLDLNVIGEPGSRWIAASVQHVQRVSAAPAAAADFDYAVELRAASFGRLLRVAKLGESVASELHPGATCYHFLRQREVPCDDCPALASGPARPWPRMAVRPLAERTGFEVVTAQVASGDVVTMSVRYVSDEALSLLLQSKLTVLARKAGLSERERLVMRYLAMGRSLQDIALITSISVRTVKFHQQNILEKLGVDSRVDLMRLLF